MAPWPVSLILSTLLLFLLGTAQLSLCSHTPGESGWTRGPVQGEEGKPDRSYQSKADSSTASSREQKVAELLNRERKSRGLSSLMVSQRAAEAARMHSSDMSRNDFFSHNGSDGADGGERLKRAGYTWSAWGEIIGWETEGSPESMVRQWMNSPPHRSAILSRDYEEFGVGLIRAGKTGKGYYWTVNFGKKSARSKSAH
jgi:uncharacterized protein YkwD